MEINREIFNTYYTADHLRLGQATAYDKRMIKLRFSYIEKYGIGKDVLDLCCGTGSYLIPMLDKLKSAFGIDFSSSMIDGFRKNLQGAFPAHLRLMESDATALPLKNCSIDFVFSYASLYYVPNLENVIREVRRVLRNGGHAALEFGNLNSLVTFVSNVYHEKEGWAKPFHIPYKGMLRLLRNVKLEVVDWHAFQILPMYGTPKNLLYLYPLLSPLWKRLFGIQIGERMLDDWLSISWPLRYIAFRHSFLVKKR